LFIFDFVFGGAATLHPAYLWKIHRTRPDPDFVVCKIISICGQLKGKLVMS